MAVAPQEVVPVGDAQQRLRRQLQQPWSRCITPWDCIPEWCAAAAALEQTCNTGDSGFHADPRQMTASGVRSSTEAVKHQ